MLYKFAPKARSKKKIKMLTYRYDYLESSEMSPGNWVRRVRKYFAGATTTHTREAVDTDSHGSSVSI